MSVMLVARLHIQYPMLFKLINNRAHRVTHCGVLEFVADEGRVYLPYWVMNAPFSELVFRPLLQLDSARCVMFLGHVHMTIYAVLCVVGIDGICQILLAIAKPIQF